ncbi:phytanoyl-CoA dioxygenase family protein [Fulvivirgaceae bacterium BMA12]|uniref:Phytanoyl-CoA dioxygenase family protein n=1 Tax=Agaribacillus aureus TaxID=3051825 RepID=A0ABT8LH28_9BACT|nr:phytanoyl-CoA dioxygenase family protein [Fulvivirgaceae bacterium BMA12]
MDIENKAQKFWEEGYLVIAGFFDKDLMDRLNKNILDHFGMDPHWEHTDEFINKSATEVVPWFPYQEDYYDGFKEVDEDHNFKELTGEILGEGWSDLYCMAMFSKEATKGQAWHQDCPPENPQQFNLNRLVYTHDIIAENGGGTIVFPGSHKMGTLTPGDPDADIPGQVVLYPKKGTLVILHGHTWHRVLPVKSKYRVSTNFRAIPENTPEDITDIAVYRNMRYKFSTREVLEER